MLGIRTRDGRRASNLKSRTCLAKGLDNYWFFPGHQDIKDGKLNRLKPIKILKLSSRFVDHQIHCICSLGWRLSLAVLCSKPIPWVRNLWEVHGSHLCLRVPNHHLPWTDCFQVRRQRNFGSDNWPKNHVQGTGTDFSGRRQAVYVLLKDHAIHCSPWIHWSYSSDVSSQSNRCSCHWLSIPWMDVCSLLLFCPHYLFSHRSVLYQYLDLCPHHHRSVDFVLQNQTESSGEEPQGSGKGVDYSS